LIVDTGTVGVYLTAEAVQKLGLTPVPAAVDNGKFRQVTLDKLCVDKDVTFLKVPVNVVENEALVRGTGMPVDGILGLQVFSLTSFLIDFQDCYITIWYPSKLTTEDIRQAGMDGATEVPIVMDHGGVLIALERDGK
jgi:hypothetical protein